LSPRSLQSGSRFQVSESYFISLNDLLVGMLFIFIILLMAFALSYQSAERDLHSRIGELQDQLNQRAALRASLLDKLGDALKREGVTVVVERDNGVLRLPERTLFDSGSADLGPPGQQALRILASTLATLLPCYSAEARHPDKCPKGSEPILEAVYVEGHTDNVPINTSRYADNWDLSSNRAIKTYRYMTQIAPNLQNIRNAANTATLFGASAYADQRPVHPNNNLTPEGRAENRRIDLRFLLAPPSRADLDAEGGLTLARRP
jgi:chemotaxis protein MotB